MPYAVCGGIKMRFEIPGRPMPKQRPRVGRYGNIYTPRETKSYEELVGIVARQHCKEPLAGDISVAIEVYGKRIGDLDNIAKSILDGMSGIVYVDDRQVTELSIRKMASGEEKAVVMVWQMGLQA